MLMPRRTQQGFTIVELLIVIVVIAILAAISVVAYQGVQSRARDSMRADTLAKIERALELYKIDHGQYPSSTASPGSGGWEASTDDDGTFMEYLAEYGFSGGVPDDPINDTVNRFYYYRYAAGGSVGTGCDVAKGGFYVLRGRFESAANKPATASIADYCTAPQSSWVAGPSNPAYATFSFER